MPNNTLILTQKEPGIGLKVLDYWDENQNDPNVIYGLKLDIGTHALPICHRIITIAALSELFFPLYVPQTGATLDVGATLDRVAYSEAGR